MSKKIIPFETREQENSLEDLRPVCSSVKFQLDVFFDKSRKQSYIIGEPTLCVVHTGFMDITEKMFLAKKAVIDRYTNYEKTKESCLFVNPAFKEDNCVLSIIGEIVPHFNKDSVTYEAYMDAYQKINKYYYMREMGIPHKQNSI